MCVTDLRDGVGHWKIPPQRLRQALAPMLYKTRFAMFFLSVREPNSELRSAECYPNQQASLAMSTYWDLPELL
jgi:hypothetical protein